MGIPIQIMWTFVAKVACAALETGIDAKGLDEMKRQLIQMGEVADLAVEAVEIVRDLKLGTRMELTPGMDKRIETLLTKVGM
jgi:hypothetical protein